MPNPIYIDTKYRSVQTIEAQRASDRLAHSNRPDGISGIPLVLIPVSEMNFHSFQNLLRENKPKLLLDTRKYPEFYSVYESLRKAREEFKAQGVEYIHLPLLAVDEPAQVFWAQLTDLKEKIDSYLQHSGNAPIFLLTSTEYYMDILLRRIRGFVSQRLSGVRLVDIDTSSSTK